MRDTVVMTEQLAAFLVPLLPYLIETDDEVGRNLDADVWEKANAIWIRLRPKIEAKESAMEVAHDASRSPQDADALAAFRFQLKKLLAEDAALAEDLAGLLQGTQTHSEEVASPEDRDIVKESIRRDWIINGNWNIVRQQDPGASQVLMMRRPTERRIPVDQQQDPGASQVLIDESIAGK